MIRAARQVILVTDSSKWGVVTFAQVTTLDAIHKIVIDDAIPADAIEALEAEGVEVVTPNRLRGELCSDTLWMRYRVRGTEPSHVKPVSARPNGHHTGGNYRWEPKSA